MAVRVHHPLKQGLRHHTTKGLGFFVFLVRVHHPLKQGLRHDTAARHKGVIAVRVHHPLKQGLRH